MHAAHIREWFHHSHPDDANRSPGRVRQLLHDSRFWSVVLLVTLFVLLLVIGFVEGRLNADVLPDSPYFPYAF